jgi:hypothetical protein
MLEVHVMTRSIAAGVLLLTAGLSVLGLGVANAAPAPAPAGQHIIFKAPSSVAGPMVTCMRAC